MGLVQSFLGRVLGPLRSHVFNGCLEGLENFLICSGNESSDLLPPTRGGQLVAITVSGFLTVGFSLDAKPGLIMAVVLRMRKAHGQKGVDRDGYQRGTPCCSRRITL